MERWWKTEDQSLLQDCISWKLQKELHSWYFNIWLLNQDLNKDSTNRHANVERWNLTGHQPLTKRHRQLMTAKRGKDQPPQQVFQYQVIGPELIYTSNIKKDSFSQLTFIFLHSHTHITIIKKKRPWILGKVMGGLCCREEREGGMMWLFFSLTGFFANRKKIFLSYCKGDSTSFSSADK